MSQSLGQGIPPHLYRILNGARQAPAEYAFPTRSAATTARHRLYAVRRKLARQGDPLSPAFDLLSITAPAERQRADGTTEWFWVIGENVLHDALATQFEAHCAAQGIDPATLDRPSFQPPPSIPLAPDAVRDGDPPRRKRDSYDNILHDMETSANAGANAPSTGEPGAPSEPKTAAELMRESIERAKAKATAPKKPTEKE